MTGKTDDGDLAGGAPSAPVTDEKVEAERRAFYGGEVDDDLDNEDFSAADRGDSITPDNVTEAANKAAKLGDGEEEEETPESEEEEEETPESEEEEEETPESEEEEEEEETPPAKAKGKKSEQKGIPKHRFDEVNERRKKAEAELEELRRQQQAREEAEEDEYDFDAAEEEYANLVLDGKVAEAKAKRKEIREAERASFQKDAAKSTAETVTTREAQTRLNSITRQAEELYPVFDENHEDFSPVITAKVMTYFRGYSEQIGHGDIKSPADAMVAAIADVAALYKLDERYGEGEVEEEEETPPPPPKKKKLPAKKQVEKKTELSKRAPKSPGTEGDRSADRGAVVPNIDDLTDEELEALPEATLAKLRGDVL